MHVVCTVEIGVKNLQIYCSVVVQSSSEASFNVLTGAAVYVLGDP